MTNYGPLWARVVVLVIVVGIVAFAIWLRGPA